MNTLLELHAPFKTAFIKKKYKPWITGNIKIMMRERDKKLKKFKRTKNIRDFEEYKHLRNSTNKSVEREKKAYLNFHISRHTNNAWDTLKKLNIYYKKKKNDIPDHLSDVNDINEFFLNSVPIAGKGSDFEQYYSGRLVGPDVSWSFSRIENNDIFKYLVTVKTTAAGADGLNIKFIILCCPFIIEYISHLLNFCIKYSVYPTQWKLANVIPLPKCEVVSELKDLRPISILPVVSKLLERSIKDQLVEFLKT
ncbi:uncharacterized protein [Leptinotarsa decemlineata]|uniref:uncharacterized protein n=1 Tax=Leptinotarsa decemlineata TaxID=7539 RepID=UPI003D305BF7